MSEQAFQIGTQIKLNDNWIMTGEEYEEGVYWPSTGDIGQIREIDEDQLWVEFPNLEGVWPVEFHIADIVKPMAEELAALANVSNTSPAEREMRPCVDCGQPTQRRWYDTPVCQACYERQLPPLTTSTEAQTFNPYAVNTSRTELLEQLFQLLYQNDILYSIEDDLLNAGDTDSDALTLWAELNVLRTALQEGEPAIIEDAFAPTSPTYPTPYAARALSAVWKRSAKHYRAWKNVYAHLLDEIAHVVHVIPDLETYDILPQRVRELQAALDQERADNVTLRAELRAAAAGRDDAIAEWQACHNILDTAQKHRAELFPKDLDNSWTGAIDRLAQGVRDERNWSRYLANKAKQYQQVADGDASIYDGLRTCKVCRDRETTRGDGVCEACYQQWMIGES